MHVCFPCKASHGVRSPSSGHGSAGHGCSGARASHDSPTACAVCGLGFRWFGISLPGADKEPDGFSAYSGFCLVLFVR